ncbi:MAG: 5'-nucleotidase C-terminal domain-containing protein [Halofilum sp. (in: g-proteobacteria)]|nr:5'-nucleotidase C-terminal domain-containing protein [Halofilum sp. (in: g-proteobacteria)]
MATTTVTPDNGDSVDTPAFELQLLHFADVDGSGGVDDADNFSALVDGFRSRQPDNTLLVSSGDNLIPGPEFFAASDDGLAGVLGEPGNGRANIAWLNEMGVAASALGNHDLDAGTEAFTELLQSDGGWPGARFPYLSANTDFSADANPEADPSDIRVSDGQPAQASSVAGSATVQVNGETIGLVGASTPKLPSITGAGGLQFSPSPFDAAVSGDLDALAEAIQPTVDALVSDGVDKIVLLAHMQQISIEKALATRLNNVDVIVAGGSNTILADGTDTLRSGDTAADTYPLEFQAPNGDPVLLVNTAGDFRYLGRLVVGFDDAGVVLPETIDAAVSGAYATDTINAAFNPIEAVADITMELQAVLQAKDGNVLGVTDVYLDGRRSQVRTEETNLGNLTADANLWLAQQADGRTLISLKNGGGIRSAIGRAVQPAGSNDPDDLQFLPPAADADIGKPAGGISQLDLETALRFNNGLTLLTVHARPSWPTSWSTRSRARARVRHPGSSRRSRGCASVSIRPCRPGRATIPIRAWAASAGCRTWPWWTTAGP